MKDLWFRKALMEAAKWDEQMTEHERKALFFADARKAVIERIFAKYKEKELKSKKPN